MCTREPESVLEPPLFRGTDEPELSYQHPCSLDHREVHCLEKMWLLVVFCLTNEYQRGLLLLVSRVVLVDDPLVVDGHRQVPDAHVATRHSL